MTLDAEVLELHTLRVEHAEDVVIRHDDQPGRIREWRVLGEHPGVDMSVGTDERQVLDVLVQGSRRLADGRVGIEVPVLIKHGVVRKGV